MGQHIKTIVNPDFSLLNIEELELIIQDCKDRGMDKYRMTNDHPAKYALIIRYLKESGYHIIKTNRSKTITVLLNRRYTW